MAKRSIVLSDHAKAQVRRRGLEEAIVLGVAENPDEVVPIRSGREIRQGVVPFPPDSTPYLVRVFVDLGSEQDTVVTAYRTSKLEKYRRSP